MSLSIPADLLDQAQQVLDPHLPDGDQLGSRCDGSAYLITDMTSAIVAALRRLPPLAASVFTPDHPLPSDLAGTVVAVANTDPASISWHVCWPGEHNRAGFQLGINGAELWHPETPPGHSLYVHVRPAAPERAQHLAAAVGGRILGEPELGW